MIIYGKKTICAAVVLVAAVTAGALAENPYQVEWTRQLGTSNNDYGHIGVGYRRRGQPLK